MKGAKKKYGPRGFIPPDRNQRLAAVALPRLAAAKVDERSRRLHAYLEEAVQDETAFRPITIPQPGQWLSDNFEPGQPVKKYIKSAHTLTTPKGRSGPPLEELLRFGEAYLQMPMALLPGLHLRPSDRQRETHLQVDFPPELRPRSAAARDQEIRWRWHHEHTKRKQLSTRDIHSLLRSVLPDDGFCLIALLMDDLFPTDNPKSYVAGEADRSNRSGVFSFSRFHPGFFTDEEELRRLAPSEKAVLLRRSCKLMVHEHCIHYLCIMNGTKGLTEGAGKPTHLCPCCLHKVFLFSCRQKPEGFDVEQRYLQLAEFFREHADGFERELAWTATELSRLEQCLPRPRRTHPAMTTSSAAAAPTSGEEGAEEECNEEEEGEEEEGQ
ncbi:Amz2 protein [Acanthamoeba castellanii str. Neff]|uniref:Amz2 protein n=1 Tax=Acanthamoeba castellanii (strain ATCC 30010 / Neff) TaxID=1257118 RepID=L8HHH0_ACACF|nr:Amz2 protein [Acanthamoeba castellanii str. Neff]ELR24138.1 Amz2 protein [Acanthamoeba castellanii str. Neff]